MHPSATVTLDGNEVDRSSVLRVSWPGTGGRSVDIETLVNVIADDEGWRQLGILADDCSQAKVTQRELRRLRAAAGEDVTP